MQGVEVVKVDEFMHLGSTSQRSGQCTRELKKKRVQAGWRGWR